MASAAKARSHRGRVAVTKSKPPAELVRAFSERGYVRVRAPRAAAEGPKSHKGYEVRIPVRDSATARRLAKLVREVGLRPGKPYTAGRRVVLPIYGRVAVESFARWVKRLNRAKAERIEQKLAASTR